jgi:3-oxoacyl-[acyl-carrier protein] reductase
MKIAMTGTTGGIGSVICNYLEESNIDVEKIKIDLSNDFEINLPNVDGLIHCAGVNYICDYQNIKFEDFEKLINVNSLSFLRLCQKLKFNYGANIVAIGSLYASSVKPQRLMYSFSKHGLTSIVKTLALEMSSEKIKVNMISPGFVDTALTRKNNSVERISELNNLIPLGLTLPKEIAKMCKYFITENQAITGQDIIIDGGYNCLEP